jgi:hypothetical protein
MGVVRVSGRNARVVDHDHDSRQSDLDAMRQVVPV